MGLLTRVKDRVKDRAVDTARKIVDKARDSLDSRMGMTTRRGEDPRVSGDGPTFIEAGDRGLDGWELGRPLLQQLAGATHGLLQARFTDSELALRDALDRLEIAVKAKDGSSPAWKNAAEQLASGWQIQNARILESWAAGFETLEREWTHAGSKVMGLPWKKAWSEASSIFDTFWLSEWDKFQATLEDVCGSLRQLFQDVGGDSELVPTVASGVWQKAISSVDGGIRRAHGDLWGAWGTGGALLRGCARKALEEQGPPAEIYPAAFKRLEEDVGKAIRVNVQDIRDSWLAAVEVLIRSVEGRA